MHGKMPANCRNKGFTLIEILIVIIIMAIVMGVVGSLLAGYMRMSNETADQSVAKRRAIDVFNAMEVPILNAALGIPTSTMAYFTTTSGGDNPPIATWQAPIEIKNTASYSSTSNQGDVLRLVYSVPSGFKNGLTVVTVYSASNSDPVTTSTSDVASSLVLTGTLDMTGIPTNDTRRYITIPDAYMSPLKVTSVTGSTINVTGKPQPRAVAASGDISLLPPRGEVRPFHDIHLVQAIAAYADNKSVFHTAEVNSADVSATSPDVAYDSLGLRVEGIKAVWFESDAAHRTLTMRVLAEGERLDQMRKDTTDTRNALKARWANVKSWDEQLYYEDFQMTWRMRNYVPN